MGFGERQAIEAYFSCEKNRELAVNLLLNSSTTSEPTIPTHQLQFPVAGVDKSGFSAKMVSGVPTMESGLYSTAVSQNPVAPIPHPRPTPSVMWPSALADPVAPSFASTSITASKGKGKADDVWKVFFQRRKYTNPSVMDQLSNVGFTHYELLNMKDEPYGSIYELFQVLLGPQCGLAQIAVLSNAVVRATGDDWKTLEGC